MIKSDVLLRPTSPERRAALQAILPIMDAWAEEDAAAEANEED